MPFIHIRTNQKIAGEAELRLKAQLGQAISLIPGKSEHYLMLQFSDGCRMHFQGDSDRPIAFVEVMLYGKASPEACGELTAAVSKALKETLGIDAGNVYTAYFQTPDWGWNGSNF